MSSPLRERLSGGPKRSLGQADAVAAEALRNSELIYELAACLRASDDQVRERAANALKKIATADPSVLQYVSHAILQAWKSVSTLAVRWNLTLVIGKLRLKPRERALVTDLLFEALESWSSFERTFAMQALADLAEEDDALRQRLRPLLGQLMEHGTAAMRARGRKLLRQLDRSETVQKAASTNRRSRHEPPSRRRI